MKSKLYFTSLRSSGTDKFFDRFQKMLKKIGFEKKFSHNDFTGIKTHFGEMGNVTYVHPAYIRFIAEYYKKFPIKLYATDTNTIYIGQRHNAVDHLYNAYANGFSYATLGIPVIIGDGLIGLSYFEHEINKELFKTVKLAKIVEDSDKMIVVSHVKGHIVGGYGGALKNLGMGFAPRPQKYAMHSTMNPFIKSDSCIGCGKCLSWCPVSAISITDHKAKIDDDLCTGCGQCLEVCPEGAINLNWNAESHRIQKAWVETAFGFMDVMGKENVLFINFINNVTPDCDCFGLSDNPIVPNVGVLVGTDPVAIDLASVELINQQESCSNSHLQQPIASGGDKFRALYPQINWRNQIDYAEKLGMGKTQYIIETV